MAIVKFKDKFGIDSVGTVNHIEVPDHTVGVPKTDPLYVFPKEQLEDMLLFMAYPGGDGLYLSGPAGCGKTSAVINLCGHLHWGLTQVTVGSRTEAADLIGRPAIRNGQIEFEYGALVKAMRAGHVLLINEVDMMPPGELAALNDVLEGRPLTVTQHEGEVIEPSPWFRVVCTANSKGNGDGYAGSRLLNSAFMDRFRVIDLDYPSPRAEETVLKLSAPALGEHALRSLMQLATELRRQSTDDNSTNQLSAPFSTRALVRTASLIEKGLPAQKAVELSFSSKLPRVEREYVFRLTSDIFGHGAGMTQEAKPARSRRAHKSQEAQAKAEEE